MACEEFRDRMLDALYGEGDAAGAREFDAHQQGCADCRDEVRALRGLRRDLREWTVTARPGAARNRAHVMREWLPLAAGVAFAIAGAVAYMGAQSRVNAVSAALRDQDARHRAEIAAIQARVSTAGPRSEATLED